MNKNKPLAGSELPYSYLIDNIKAILIFLVVFNHLIAFALVKESSIIRHVWYGITIFHMPAFVFVSGYLSKSKQSQYKNFKNLMIPYVLGYTFTWAATVWTEQSMAYDLLRPSGTAMWYLLALFIYRSSIEALGRIRFVVPLTILLAIWAGTRPEFSTYLSVSRIVVFFPFFIAGYLWSNKNTQRLRTFKGKWVLFFLSASVLTMIPVYMINQQIPIDLLRENHGYLMSGVSNQTGITLRLLMFLASFIVILTLLALIPDCKTPLTFIGRNTMSIYFIHYPLLIALNGMKVFNLPSLKNIPGNILISLAILIVLGCLPVHWLYSICMSLISKIIMKADKADQESSQAYLQDEYDNDDYFSYISDLDEEEEEEQRRGSLGSQTSQAPYAYPPGYSRGGQGGPAPMGGQRPQGGPAPMGSAYSGRYGSEYQPGPSTGQRAPSQGRYQNYPEDTYPGPEDTYPGTYQDDTYPGNYREDTYPGLDHSYPGGYGNYLDDTYPGDGNTYPGPENTYPGPEDTYPGPNGTYPGPDSTYPGPDHTYPGPEGTYPGPEDNYPEETHSFFKGLFSRKNKNTDRY